MQRVSVQQLVELCEQNISVPAAISLVDDLISLPAGFIFWLNSTCSYEGYLYDWYMTRQKRQHGYYTHFRWVLDPTGMRCYYS